LALILHLTDLHIDAPGKEQVLDDYKSDIVPPDERVDRLTVLRSTLRNIGRHLRERRSALDAVVISGDITVRCHAHGLEMLPGLLDELGEAKPALDHIVVVPGNHDVAWNTPPSSAQRYENFLKLVRENGYTTPLLDGIDLPKKPAVNFSRNYLALDCGAVEIVPLNSSN
jgi:3',5'-cyclic AMP phosphodiesterase CpdA